MKVYLVGGAVRDELLGRPGRRARLGRGRRDARGDAGPRATAGRAATSRCSCIPRRARSTRSRAPSARRGPAIAASSFTTRPTSRSRTTSRGATSRSTRWRATPTAQLIDPARRPRRPRGAEAAARVRAFDEDPVRILRVARFLARFEPLGFTIAPETLARMRAMVAAGRGGRAGARAHLAGDRPRARREPAPARMAARAARLRRARAHLPGARRALRRAAARRNGIRKSTRACTWSSCCRRRPPRAPEPRIRFAALMHDLGKGRTPRSQWPRHIGHEERGARLRRRSCRRGCACRWTTASSPCSPRAGTASPIARRNCGRARCSSCSSPATRSAGRSASASCCVACEADYRGRGGLAAAALSAGGAAARGAGRRRWPSRSTDADREGLAGREDRRTAAAAPARGAQAAA